MFKQKDIAMRLVKSMAAGMLLSVSVAPANADEISTLINDGTDTVPACISCHGEGGLGDADMGSPMLAGQDAAYLAATLRGFADGSRPGDTMAGIGPELTSQQIDGLAAYYAGLAPSAVTWPATSDAPPPDQALGARIFRDGDWANGVPGCVSCHGQNGEGVGATFPRIAGQLPDYMQIRFEQFADPAITYTPDQALMAAVARNLPAESRDAVLSYLSTLDPAAGAVTTNPDASLAWDEPKLPDAPLPDGINWKAAETAYEKQEQRLAGPNLFTQTAPSVEDIPDTPEGEMIRYGRAVFIDTQSLRGTYVGNDLSCANCHMGAGANPVAAPVWATVVDFPQYRGKNLHVNTTYERIAGCFSYSMNGTPPAPQSKVAVALESYMKWLGTGIPSDAVQKARGYVYLPVPDDKPDFARGEAVYTARCAVCHGADGQGSKNGDRVVFPPLWGPNSFNWGAGMHDLEKAAGFIRHNMPLGNPDLTDAQAWDVALYMNSHERPQDPRWLGNVADTRRFFHRSANTYGLETPNGVMGDTGEPLPKPPGIPMAESGAPKPPAKAREQLAAEGDAPKP